MRLLLLLTTISSVPTLTHTKTVGSFQVQGYGEVFILAPDWAAENIQILDNGFSMSDNTRLYLGSEASDVFAPDNYWQAPLTDKHFSYTVDLSRVGCGCNAAAYFVSMPGLASTGGDYYCDANYGNNQWCPEYDIMEANKYTMASTIHACDKNPSDDTWNTCDRAGCQRNAYYVDHNMMCPEERCTINTNRPFNVSHFQNAEEVEVSLKQDDKSASFAVCTHGGYVSNMAPAFDGMVFAAALWGSPDIDMGWLDGMTGCKDKCWIPSARVTFSHFELTA